MEEIVTELLPRKVTLQSPDDADGAIPELLAFWEYLKREYRLPQADPVLRFLREVQPRFKELMDDPQKFGLAKSILMMGQSAGFDMTNEESANAFIAFYKHRSGRSAAGEAGLSEGERRPAHPSGSQRRHAKSRRKAAKTSRKQGRKKRQA